MDCPVDEVITLISECEFAAVSLGIDIDRYEYDHIGTSDEYHAGCSYMLNTIHGITDIVLQFNYMLNPSVTKPKADEVGICRTDGINFISQTYKP